MTTTTDIAREATGPQETGSAGEGGHSRLGWALVLGLLDRLTW